MLAKLKKAIKNLYNIETERDWASPYEFHPDDWTSWAVAHDLDPKVCYETALQVIEDYPEGNHREILNNRLKLKALKNTALGKLLYD